MSNSFGRSTARRHKPHHFAPHLLAIIGVIVAVYLAMRPTPPPEEPAKKPPPSIESVDGDKDSRSRRGDARSAENSDDSAAGALVAQDITIRDRDGNVVLSGDVDLSPTIQRIAAGGRLEGFRNDGAGFQNRERRLPIKPPGYYQEFVHPTPGLDGPGPQRIVIGQNSEIYYTPDHYQTFKRMR